LRKHFLHATQSRGHGTLFERLIRSAGITKTATIGLRSFRLTAIGLLL
jgi:hypothetical protein